MSRGMEGTARNSSERRSGLAHAPDIWEAQFKSFFPSEPAGGSKMNAKGEPGIATDDKYETEGISPQAGLLCGQAGAFSHRGEHAEF